MFILVHQIQEIIVSVNGAMTCDRSLDREHWKENHSVDIFLDLVSCKKSDWISDNWILISADIKNGSI